MCALFSVSTMKLMVKTRNKPILHTRRFLEPYNTHLKFLWSNDSDSETYKPHHLLFDTARMLQHDKVLPVSRWPSQ